MQNSSSSTASPITITLGDATQGVSAHFTPPADSGTLSADIAMPLAREKTDTQLSMEALSVIYPIDRLWDYQALLPHPELFCDEPSNGDFAVIAEQLGGFNKTSHIWIESDATAPTVQSGWMKDYHSNLNSFNELAAFNSSVQIQRPDIVGRSGTKAFYLSDTYGLITVDYAGVPISAPQVSCGLALPGNPKNFVVTEQNLYALIDGNHNFTSGVLQFDISQAAPVFISGVVFEQQRIEDARLFNDTLALYMQSYAVQYAQTTAEPATTSMTADLALPLLIDSATLVGYELKTLATNPTLSVTHREALLSAGDAEPVSNAPNDIESPYQYSYFNSFLSASGEYLVVTKSIHERLFDRYKTESRYRCDDYHVIETPFHYCNTVWKRSENPDYQPLPSSGVVDCNGDLLSCIKQQLPTVSRYILVPDGQQCHDEVRRTYQCQSGQMVTYQVPQYTYQNKTQFYVFHFDNNEFVRLDDQLATLQEDQIVVTAAPFVLNGDVQKHDHIRFHKDYLYVITNDDSGVNEINLNTLAIVGNAAMRVNTLTLSSSESYPSLNAAYTDSTLYLSDSNYRNKSSDIITVSLADPLSPNLSQSLRIETQLQQLLFDDNQLIGVGRVSTPLANTNLNRSLGSVTSFSNLGEERDNILLGADYQYYASQIDYDDQVLNYDNLFNRLFLPYSVYLPISGNSGPPSASRLSVIGLNEGDLIEEGMLSLPQLPDRTLSLDNNNALAFSAEYIHHLSKDGRWQSSTLMDGAIPDSIYYSREFPNQVQKYTVGENTVFKLVDAAEGASGALLDQKSVEHAGTSVCLEETILFDRDRVLVVQEQPDHYVTYQDCPNNNADLALDYIGYRITADALVAITDESELAQLYSQSQWQTICIADVNEVQGEFLTGLDLNETDQLECFTYEQFWQLLSEQPETP